MTDEQIQQRAEELDQLIQRAISAVRCNPSIEVGVFSYDIAAFGRACRDEALVERDKLRAALAGLVGVDNREELEQMELVMRATPMPAEDRARTIDAIHALRDTLPAPPAAATEEP